MVLVSISDILDIVKEFKRPLVESEAILRAKMLIAVGKITSVDAEDHTLKISALCLQSSAVFSEPHKIDVELNMDSIYNRIKTTSCSCKAGASEKCKHVVATLMHLNKLDDETALDELSATDLAQQWGKMKTEVKGGFEAMPISEFCHFPQASAPVYSRGVPNVAADLVAEFKQLILAEQPQSEIYLHQHGARAAASLKNCQGVDEDNVTMDKLKAAYDVTIKIVEKQPSPVFQALKDVSDQKIQSLSQELAEFFEKNVRVSKEASATLASTTVTQTDEKWYQERNIRITGSKCYQLFTYASNKKPDWEKKLTSIYKSSFSGNEATVHGMTCEPLARETYVANENKIIIENGLFVHPDLSWLGFSADGICVDDDGSPCCLLEIKSPSVGKNVPSSELVNVISCCDKGSKKLKTKHDYYGQVQLGMLLLNLTKCDFILYASSDESYALEEIQFDPDFAFNMVSTLLEVYFDRILPWLCKHNK